MGFACSGTGSAATDNFWLLVFFNYYYFFLAAQNELHGRPAKLPAVLLEVLFAGVPGVMLPLLRAV